MKKLPKNRPILSIVILNYNSSGYLKSCLQSLQKSPLSPYTAEVIVYDNFSSDNSFQLARTLKGNSHLKFIFKKGTQNRGFSAGNNAALKFTSPHSKYVLFLNPDTTVRKNTLQKMIDFFKNSPKVDAATCNLILVLSGQTQPESHRGFPTPWNTFVHFFGFGLPKLFPKSRLLNGYFMGHLDYRKPQLIDACTGAFIMLKRSVGESIGWWNEKYFFYGEDLDLCWQLRQKNYQLYFYPGAKAYHYQGMSSGIVAHSQKKSAASRSTRLRAALASTEAMRIFYRENLMSRYPPFAQKIIWQGIALLEKYRLFKAKYL